MFGFRRIAAGLIALALGTGLLGTCPCAVASHDACGPAADRPATPSGCCDDAATGFRAAACCEASDKGEVKALASAVRTQGPASILDVHEGWSDQVLVVRPSFVSVGQPPAPPRLGGSPVLRI